MISGIQKLTLLDYPGEIACVLFISGCNMRCPFCHNAALVFNSSHHYEFETILDFLKARINRLTGVVISGGEPTLDPQLLNYIKAIKQLGFKVKLDTNGSQPDVVQYLIDNCLIDAISMDVKNAWSKYNLTTGSTNSLQKIQQSIQLLLNSSIWVEFRTTIVDGFHTYQDVEEILSLIKGAKRYTLQTYQASESVINPDICHTPTSEFMHSLYQLAKQSIDHVTLK